VVGVPAGGLSLPPRRLARRLRRQRRAPSVRVRVLPSRVPVAGVSSMLYTRENTRRNARDETNDDARRAVLRAA